ncbi:Uncharacterised protein [Burkholderia pseudomallei]|nr:Uncharacterised protein [Burkholderia pseudomallei]
MQSSLKWFMCDQSFPAAIYARVGEGGHATRNLIWSHSKSDRSPSLAPILGERIAVTELLSLNLSDCL